MRGERVRVVYGGRERNKKTKLIGAHRSGLLRSRDINIKKNKLKNNIKSTNQSIVLYTLLVPSPAKSSVFFFI